MIFKKKKIKNYKDLGPPVNVKENFSNLIFITKIIKNLEYFVFFGTLLGLVRDNNLIKNDDDIDIYQLGGLGEATSLNVLGHRTRSTGLLGNFSSS